MSTNSINLIPQEIKSETQLGKGIFLTDVVVIVCIYLVLDFLKPLVHPTLQMVYTICTVFLGFIITRKSRMNPEKKIFHSLLFKIIKDKKTYHRREKEPEEVKTKFID